MKRRLLESALAYVLVLSAGTYGGVVTVPVSFSGPGNLLTANGTLVGSASVSGGGGVYTYDDANEVWVASTFTVPLQSVPIAANPFFLALSSSPTGSMTINIDNTDPDWWVESFFDIFFDLRGGGGGGGGALTFNLAPTGITVNLDGGGTTTIDLAGSGVYAPLKWAGLPNRVHSGVSIDVVGMAGPIPLGYLFNASYSESQANNVVMSPITITEGIGPWYAFRAEFSADFDDITLSFSESGTFSMNTYSGSQYPYYALTLNYDVSGCAALCNVHGDFSGVGEIPEPTTLALVLLGPAMMRLRRRS